MAHINGVNVICQSIVISSNFMPILSRRESVPCKFSANDSLTSPEVRHRGLGHDYDLRRDKIGTGRTGTSVNGGRTITGTRPVSVRRENRLWPRYRGGKEDLRSMGCRQSFRGGVEGGVRLLLSLD